ncbi:MAG: NAD(P)-binding protein [Deltaproteobacteria bacterium]|nr:NAD(P)-binding protein [Deltaproteobacteria bacterium]
MSRTRTNARPVIVVGAGLTGLMLASYLGPRGHAVRIYESRPRALLLSTPKDRSRAMSMDLSARGLRALSDIGLLTKLRA